jgi:hypothetical protein
VSDTVHVGSDSPTRLAHGVQRYGQQVTDALVEVTDAARDFAREIACAVDERRFELEAARAAMEACLETGGADCSDAVAGYRRAEDRMRLAVRARDLLQHAEAEFTPARARCNERLSDLIPRASHALAELESRLTGYLAVTMTAGGAGDVGPGRGSGVGVPAANAAGMAALPGGVSMVSIDSIVDDGSITGPADFTKGYNIDDLSVAFEMLLDVVLPAVALGKDRDYFRERDAAANRYGTRSLSDTFSGFFGDSAIALERQPDGCFRVANGRHRIWLARHLGITSVPARVQS